MALLRFFLLACTLVLAKGQATFRLANIYQDDMVLQMEPKIAVLWGYGEAGAEISVNYESNQLEATVNDQGIWQAFLLPHAAGGPVNFEITQVYNSTEETNTALTYQNIRLLKVQRDFNNDTELAEVQRFATPWSAPTSTSVPTFSALCLFFGERISESFGNNRPIGLIDATWGGTRIEAWFSSRVPVYCLTPPNDGSDQNSESALWNAMIAPLSRTAVRGAIWYQGEANVGKNPDYYSCHVTAMVQDWRNTFVSGTIPADNGAAFPFGIVQLGPTVSVENYNWGKLRLHQTADQGVLPNPYIPEGFMATAYDLTDSSSPTGAIHPRDKQTVADRLANAAKNLLYGENLRKYGPVPLSIAEESPGQITIFYDSNIRLGGPDGFAFQRSDGTWGAAAVTSSSSTLVRVAVDADAALLTLGFRSMVCEYKQCPVYSDDAESVPAQVWQWDLSSIRHQSKLKI